ncbi:E3 ubiquitin-protein ligase RBBP6-like isoform X4 [Dunckerocampus dactyliophorus]|uniref:E3 ubiquitin-protein ligase RBBP6-like isoform X4 n=1 Tax=Dunckerocampus dactyliophorus TaxID=161453 RepID=UPI002407626F|nr:E3 ubiquitin-protein ligase RBBP6-like isoform X4 [Dunckerocampus dactyliophorus]
MSHVHYKFFSRTNSVTAIFTEPLITVKELKRHIMAKERLRFSNLLISNAQTNEEYTDDDVVIPRGVSVIVKRVPGSGLMTHKNIDQSDNYASRKVKTEAPVAMKKSTGIPCSFMLQVDDPNVKGAMMTTCGHYAIPAIDAQAYAATKKAGSLGAKKEPKPEHREDPVPVELQCLICHDLLVDAAIIPCCGNSYCDDCIRTTLLESEGHICPTCNQSDVSPDTLIANKFLRQAVGHFKDKKNITRTAIRKSDSALPLAAVPAPSLGLPTPPPLNSQHQKTLNQPNAGSHCPQALFLSEAHTAFRLPSHQLACVASHSQSVYKRSFPCQSKTCHSPSQCRRSSCRFRYRSRSPSSCPTVPYTSHSSICNHKPSHSPAQLLSSHHQQVHSHRKSKAGHAKKHLDLTAKNRKRERKRTHKTRQKTYAGEQSR